MVKCCIFIIGLALVFGGFGGMVLGAYNTWFYAELDPGIFLGIGALILGIFLIYQSDKIEGDEMRRSLEAKQRREEEERQKEIQKEKEKFLREKQWEKELDIKYCVQCGTKLEVGQKFCVSCGNPIN